MMRKKILMLLGSVCLALVLAVPLVAGCPAPAPAPEVIHLKIVSGPVGGGWFPMAAALSSIIEDKVPGARAAPTLGGGVSNCRDVEANRAQIGLTFTGTALDAWNARTPFEKEHRNLRYLATQSPSPEVIVSLAETGIKTMDDLRGKAFSPGKEGYTGKLIFDRMLEEAGMSYDDLGKCTLVGYSDGAMLLKDKHIDFYAMCDLPPSSPFMEVDAFFPVTILELPEDLLDTMAEKYGMMKITVPAGVYAGVEKDVTVVAYGESFIINKDVPEDVVYDITKGLWEEYERMKAAVPASRAVHIKLENALKGVSIPLHPGAYRYYVEQGMTIPEVGKPID